MGRQPGSSREQAETAPTTPLDAPRSKTSESSYSGGGYGRQAMAHLAADGLEHTRGRGNEDHGPEPGAAGAGFWDRSVRNWSG